MTLFYHKKPNSFLNLTQAEYKREWKRRRNRNRKIHWRNQINQKNPNKTAQRIQATTSAASFGRRRRGHWRRPESLRRNIRAFRASRRVRHCTQPHTKRLGRWAQAQQKLHHNPRLRHRPKQIHQPKQSGRYRHN